MDHLPLKAPIPGLIVRVCGDTKYDGLDFWTFPHRQGWAYDVVNGAFAGRTVGELAALLQGWLFFGLLSHATRVPFDRADFITADSTGAARITTAALADVFVKWRSRITALAEAPRREEAARVSTLLSQVSGQLWLSDADVAEEKARTVADVDAGVVLSLSMILHTITTAAQFIFPHSDVPWYSWPQPGIRNQARLREMLMKNGWCRSLIRQAFLNLNIDAVLYVISLGPCKVTKDHSKCTDYVCYALQTSGVQLPPHITKDCPCEPLGPDQGAVRAIIGEGGMPLLQFAAGPDKSVILLVKKYQSNDKYIALSHVCAEGTGNTETNEMPYCWFGKLFELLYSMVFTDSTGYSWRHDPFGSPMWFWMDTLCIPVQPQYQHLRDKAIQKMHFIYKQAARVLVLDAELQQVELDSNPNEVLAKTLLSGWRQRLWTLQEGVLCPAIDVAIKGNRTVSIHKTIHDKSFNDVTQCHTIDMSLRSSLQQLLQFPILTIDEAGTELEPEKQREQRMLAAFRDRFASRPGDETICIATFLGIDPGPLLGLPEADRMPKFLEMLPHVPYNVILAGGPRVNLPGFRWAPQTLLAPHGIGMILKNSYPRADGTGKQARQPRDPNELSPQGLHTTAPGLRLIREAGPLPDLLEDNLFVIVDNDVVLVTIMKTDRECFAPLMSSFGSEPFLALLFGGKDILSRDQAVMVAIDTTTVDGLIMARYCCRLGVIKVEGYDEIRLRQNYQTSKYAVGNWIEPMPRWCVD